MDIQWLLALQLTLISIGLTYCGGISEYCQWQVFNATCSQDEIVVMTRAEYGRMHLGQCLTTDVYIGCGSDVLAQMDAKCSGKQTCQLVLPDPTLHQLQPCPRDMMAYLEASYTCIKVASLPDSTPCMDTYIKPLTNSTGLLSSSTARRTGYGLPGCPWTVHINDGQHIRVSVLDFGLATRYKSETWNTVMDDRDYCYVYAVIREAEVDKEFTVCAGNQREDEVYVSTSNRIEVVIIDGDSDENSQNFVVKYEAVGCADIKPPANAYVLHSGEGVTITCNSTTQAWHLVCKDTEWIGEFGECVPGGSGAAQSDEESIPSYGLILAILIGVAIGVMVGFTLLAGVLWCRRHRHLKVPTEEPSEPQPQISTLPMCVSNPSTPSCKVHRLKGEYGYTHVWEVQHSPGGVTTRPIGTRTPDSAYQSYQSQQNRPVNVETPVCYHPPKRDHEYESPKFETFGVGPIREGLLQKQFYQGCGKTCTMKPRNSPQCGDSLDSGVVHIEVGLDTAPTVRAATGVGGQVSSSYSMAGETKPSAENNNSAVLDNGADGRGNHYT